MSISVNLVEILANIRHQIIAILPKEWVDIVDLTNVMLGSQLNPMVLLPVATGIASGGKIEQLIDVAASIVLVDLSLRIIDDCADRDNDNALYHTVGFSSSSTDKRTKLAEDSRRFEVSGILPLFSFS